MADKKTPGDEAVLRVEIKNKKPVELTDLTSALTALGRQYQRYLSEQEEAFTREESKLYIKEIRPGSIVAELIGYAAGNYKEIAEVAKTSAEVIGFARKIKQDLKALTKGEKDADKLPARDLKDLNRIVEVTAKDPGSLFNIEASQGGVVNVTLNLNSLEANAIQNQAGRLIELKKEPEQTYYDRVLMRWHTASLGGSSNKAIIEKVTDRPLAVVIENDEWKQQMLAGKANPLLIGFLVDVEVLTVQGQPKAYRVTNFYESITDDAGDA